MFKLFKMWCSPCWPEAIFPHMDVHSANMTARLRMLAAYADRILPLDVSAAGLA